MSDLCQLLYGDRFRMMFLYISENRSKCFGHPGFCRNRVFALFILIFRTLISNGGKGLRNFWLDMQSGSDAVSAEAVLYSNFLFLD